MEPLPLARIDQVGPQSQQHITSYQQPAGDQRCFIRILNTETLFHGQLALLEYNPRECFQNLCSRVLAMDGNLKSYWFPMIYWFQKIKVHVGTCVVLPLSSTSLVGPLPLDIAKVISSTCDSQLTYYLNHPKQPLPPDLLNTHVGCVQTSQVIVPDQPFLAIIILRQTSWVKVACIFSGFLLVLSIGLGICAGFVTQKGEIGVGVAAGVLTIMGLVPGLLALMNRKRVFGG
ncbi:hypothetical protein ABW19_dt0204077 [Dactylella cylindrospora]|nr:hypothetical protein ABW19_dt0204077 [Dactylella cylindrospora]